MCFVFVCFVLYSHPCGLENCSRKKITIANDKIWKRNKHIVRESKRVPKYEATLGNGRQPLNPHGLLDSEAGIKTPALLFGFQPKKTLGGRFFEINQFAVHVDIFHLKGSVFFLKGTYK